MKKIMYVLFFFFSGLLASCSSNPMESFQQVFTVPKAPAHTIEQNPEIGVKSMDADDKDKMSHALDQGLGKSTEWSNARTGIKYTVTPVKKVSFETNSICREYTVVITKGEAKRDLSGTACVSVTDSKWYIVK
jgi:surface antigen